MKPFRLLFIVVFLLFSGRNGYAQKKLSNQNLATLYHKDASYIHPQLVVYHLSDDISELHFKINTKELLYTRTLGSDNFSASFTVGYKLYASFESKTILDSASVKISDTEDGVSRGKEMIGTLNIKAPIKNTYVLEVNVTDLNRNQSSRDFLSLIKQNNMSEQNFILRSKETQLPLFSKNIHAGQEFSIAYRGKGLSKLYARFYRREFPLAAPPFSITPPKPFEYIADSLFMIPVDTLGVANVKLFSNGLYYFQTDSNFREGISVFNFNADFPEIQTVETLLPPLRFITSHEEFDEIAGSKSKKEGVDNFWIKSAGSQDRARDAIRKYYNRVIDANNYFTSYLEGWKTDRGMIYIIYGSPNVVYKTSAYETWTYGEDNSIMSLSFTFDKVSNPFTDNDYILDRSPVLKNSWYRAVDIWRQGRVYLEN